MTHKVVFSPEAQADLLDLYDFLADRAGASAALRYLERVLATCQSLELAPHRGTRRDEVRPGLRTFGFERRITVAFHIAGEIVAIDRILYGDRDLGEAFPVD